MPVEMEDLVTALQRLTAPPPKEVLFNKLDDLTPEKYRPWRQSVVTTLQLNGWNTAGLAPADMPSEAKQKRAARLILNALIDQAAVQIAYLDRTTLTNGEQVLEKLDSLILTSMGEALALTEFESMAQKGGEDVATYAIRVRNTFQRAYPGSDYTTNRASKRQLVMGLTSSEMRKHALLQQKALESSTNYDTLVENLRMYEAVEGQLNPSSKKIHQLGAHDYGGSSQGGPSNSARSGACHYCGEVGHFQRDCPPLKKAKAYLEEQKKRGEKKKGKKKGNGGNAKVNALTEPTEDADVPLFGKDRPSGN